MKFGQKAKDKVTGFEGIITAECKYMTGCNQFLVQPPVKDGEYKDGKWFDEGRLSVIDGGIAEDSVKGVNNGFDIEAPIK